MNLLRPIASFFGYDIIRKNKDILLHRHLRNVLENFNVNCVIDVGANMGQYAQMLRSIGYKGVIHSFEPLQETYAKLREISSSDGMWHAHQCALGAKECTMDINVAAYSDFSSFLSPNQYCADTFNHKSMIDRVEVVQVKTLDQVAGELGITNKQHVIHLKMDTQGYDLEVFKGCRDSLTHVATMQSEISIRELYHGMPDYLESLATYRNAGFSISGLFPVTRDKNDLSVIEFDCVMVKTGTGATND